MPPKWYVVAVGSSTVVFMHVYFSPAFNATRTDADTTRKAVAFAESLATEPIGGLKMIEPSPATFDELARTHDVGYINAVIEGVPLTLAQSNDLPWDDLMFTSAAASTGGVRDAALHALSSGANAGSLSSGLHHARSRGGFGFCTFNGLVVAARAAIDAGASRVVIVDFDAHCGGGTAELIDGIAQVEQYDLSVFAFDGYLSTQNASCLVFDGTDYVAVAAGVLAGIEDPGSIDLVLYNAGMDVHRDAGGVKVVNTATVAAREQLVFEWAASHAVPVAWVLAGGYTTRCNMGTLVGLHRLTALAACHV